MISACHPMPDIPFSRCIFFLLLLYSFMDWHTAGKRQRRKLWYHITVITARENEWHGHLQKHSDFESVVKPYMKLPVWVSIGRKLVFFLCLQSASGWKTALWFGAVEIQCCERSTFLCLLAPVPVWLGGIRIAMNVNFYMKTVTLPGLAYVGYV